MFVKKIGKALQSLSDWKVQVHQKENTGVQHNEGKKQKEIV